MSNTKVLSGLSLFSGAGGMDVGFIGLALMWLVPMISITSGVAKLSRCLPDL
jgi:hypothetical protein